MSDLITLVIHGRGGQGAVTACEIIAEAAYLSGNFKDVHAYPSFGAERRGAPIQAYAKLSKNEKIWDRSQIEKPNIVIILDETVLTPVIASSLEKNGIILVNSEKEPGDFSKKYDVASDVNVYIADISKLAAEKELIIEGIPIVNIGIMGLLSKALPDLSLENLKEIVQKRMKGDIGTRNIELMEQAFNLARSS